jgi:ubiquinone biosynthesis protein
MKSLLSLQALAQDVPAQLAQIVVDLEAGKLRVNVHSDELERVAANVRTAGLTILLGLGAASFTIGGFMLLVTAGVDKSGLLWTGVGALAFASALVGAALATHVAGAPRRKISLRRWFRRAAVPRRPREAGGPPRQPQQPEARP